VNPLLDQHLPYPHTPSTKDKERQLNSWT